MASVVLHNIFYETLIHYTCMMKANKIYKNINL